MAGATVLDHPLVTHKLALLRNVNTPSGVFRRTAGEVTLLLAYEALRDLTTANATIQTPLEATETQVLVEPHPCVVGILRAGLVMVEAILMLLPDSPIGHLGMARDHDTHEPVPYYAKLPSDISKREVILVDPMLATGGSAIAAIDALVAEGCTNIRLLSIVGCDEGIDAVLAKHPNVSITLAAKDPVLDQNAYIRPGLGDAGDRLYGTL
jgi:uracil phosphoribosyltransferase